MLFLRLVYAKSISPLALLLLVIIILPYSLGCGGTSSVDQSSECCTAETDTVSDPILSSSLDIENNPIYIGDTFPSGTDEVFLTIFPGKYIVCCDTVKLTVNWYYEGNIIATTFIGRVSGLESQVFTSLSKPKGDFNKGNYLVVISGDISGNLESIPFKLV